MSGKRNFGTFAKIFGHRYYEYRGVFLLSLSLHRMDKSKKGK
jgi:hypothetical protein